MSLKRYDSKVFSGSFIICFLLLMLSGAIFIMTRDMTPGAERFPRIIASAIAFFCIVELSRYIIQDFQNRKESASKKTNETPSLKKLKKASIKMTIFFVLVVFFILAFDKLGFELSAMIFMFVGMTLLGGRKSIMTIVISILVPISFVLIFRWGLSLRLPTLPLFH